MKTLAMTSPFGPTETIIAAGVGCLIGLVNVRKPLDPEPGEERTFVTFHAFLWAYLLSSWLALSAGEQLGTITRQVGSHRDPEGETEIVRQVSDAQRWHIGMVAMGRLWIPMMACVGLIWLIVRFQKKLRLDFFAEYSEANRMAFGIWLAVAILVLFGAMQIP